MATRRLLRALILLSALSAAIGIIAVVFDRDSGPSIGPAPSQPKTWHVTAIGRVVAPTGVPIVGARLTSDSATVTVSLESGRFALGCVPDAEITVWAEGFHRSCVDVPQAAKGVHDLGDIVLAGDGVLTVQVVDKPGDPVAALPVAWTDTRKAEMTLNPEWNPYVEEARWVHAGRTDRDGLLTISGLPVGRQVLVRVLKDGAPVVSGPVRPRTADDPAFVRFVAPSVHLLTVRAGYADGEPITDPVAVRRLDGPLAGRWQRKYQSVDGRAEAPLVEGAYEIEVLVEGRVRKSRRFLLAEDATVDFHLHKYLQVELAVTGPGGDPVAEFFVTVDPLEGHDLYHSAQRGERGKTTLRLPYDRDMRERDRGELEFLVRAPGYAIARSVMVWAEGDAVLRHRVRLEESGVVIHGLTKHLPGGTAVACYLLATEPKTDRRFSWRAEDAPRTDLTHADAGGSWTVRGLGPGLYEVRALVGHSEIGLGRIEASANERYDLCTEYSPARVEVYLDPPLDTGPMPVLFPLQKRGEWEDSDEQWRLGASAIGGTACEGRVVFEPLAAGHYALHLEHVQGHRVWAPSGGMMLELEHGKTRAVHLGAQAPWERASFLASVPPSLSEEALVYAAVPCARPPDNAANLAWTDLTSHAPHTILAPRGEPFHVIVAVLPSGPSATRRLHDCSVFPVFFERVASARELEGRTLTISEPARARVAISGARACELELIHQELDGVLLNRVVVSSEARFPPLMPGPYRFTAREAVNGWARTLEGHVELNSAPPLATIDIKFR